MIGSTAQQFHTYLSHRGEETGNIRGSMRVRVPSERMGTRERLYEWISVDKDETGGPKGKSTMVSRVGHEYVKPSVVRKQLGELGKVSEEGERSSKEETAARPKQDAPDGDPSISKNSYNNPAYYILEGVPNQSAAALSPELLPSPTSANPQMAKTLSESEFPGQPPRAPSAPPPLRGQPMGLGLDACRTFPPRNPITESIAEDMPEEALWGSSSSSLSVGESSVGEWLQRLGLERYEKGLLHNGWDDLEFLSDITEEDLEEAGSARPGTQANPAGEPQAAAAATEINCIELVCNRSKLAWCPTRSQAAKTQLN
ncbi:Phosphatidylinositol 3,4,5-trisphosphate 5-phosphatase 2A [Larimichthys crocea]|uniref:Uncharacterized protein n=1 Tax=Larimichthys crocea TaxID=215358 RepID=A0ACD3QJU4_LARCR|nr:Phosphatidylinositol 3,4,5-trisphosphate 5-phosphatase 2A [Larimichthys crocea]